jgi:hypothetical protein
MKQMQLSHSSYIYVPVLNQIVNLLKGLGGETLGQVIGQLIMGGDCDNFKITGLHIFPKMVSFDMEIFYVGSNALTHHEGMSLLSLKTVHLMIKERCSEVCKASNSSMTNPQRGISSASHAWGQKERGERLREESGNVEQKGRELEEPREDAPSGERVAPSVEEMGSKQ